MRYITLWTSATGKKFKELHAKLQIAQSAARKLATKYKIKQWHAAYWAKYGGMSSVLFKEGVVPDEKIWKKSKDDNGFWEPRCNCKEGKAIDKEIKALPQISWEETNACISWEEGFSSIGFNFENKKYVGILSDEKWGIKMPKDCKEITVTEWNKLFPEKKEKKKK